MNGRVSYHLHSGLTPSASHVGNIKIMELKREGKIQNKSTSSSASSTASSSPQLETPLDKLRSARKKLNLDNSVTDDYAEKLGAKLGGRKGRMLGMNVPSVVGSDSSANGEGGSERKPKLGALDMDDVDFDEDEDDDDFYPPESEEDRRERMEIGSAVASDTINMLRRNVNVEDDTDDDLDDVEMMEAVARALSEKEFVSSRELVLEEKMSGVVSGSSSVESTVESDVNQAEKKVPSSTGSYLQNMNTATASSTAPASTSKTTSGVGGSWAPLPEVENYNPSKSGTWGAFPRPRNISVAYGGGKRIGAGVMTDEAKRQQSIEDTKEKLRAYRERMGIEVQSEKDHADVIDEALAIAGRAMQRGSYSTGVSALEKVTQYCSTKSKVGGKVFLELAMAYEAEGKTDQAISLYAALTKSPIEQIKMNAEKLLYGLEAMNFMRNEAKLKDFSRKKVAETFIDATGFNDITKNFDKVYNTAYIDLDKGSQYYRMLSENVVRSTREARQILLKAVGSGEVERIKIVQALRSFSRHFDDALAAEKKKEASKNVPVDYAGRPITTSLGRSEEEDLAKVLNIDGFICSDPTQTLSNLNGEWRLQLMADRKGEGVDFFNSTLLWQVIDTTDMSYRSEAEGGFRTTSSQSGNLIFDERERSLVREGVSDDSGGSLFKLLGGGKVVTARAMTNNPQQILSVDSSLLVTRAIVTGKVTAVDNVKDYFSVWRRAEPGTFASKK